MNVFAGSQHQAGRRRRRLAADDVDLLLEYSTDEQFRRQSVTAAPLESCASQSDELLPKFILRRLWKHSLLMLVCAALAFTAVAIDRSFAAADPPTRMPRVREGLAGIYLLVSGQLALIVGWIRSRSAVDFSGRYRWWAWLGMLMIAAAAVGLTNTEHSLPILAAQLAEPLIGGVSAARTALVLVPLLAVGSLVVGKVLPDMSRCRSSQILFAAGLLLGMLVPVLRSSLAGNFNVAPDLVTTILLSAVTAVLSAMLQHSRFVLYVCNDPPLAVARAASAAKAAKPEVQSDPAQQSSESGESVLLQSAGAEQKKETPASARSGRQASADRIVADETIVEEPESETTRSAAAAASARKSVEPEISQTAADLSSETAAPRSAVSKKNRKKRRRAA